MSRPPSAVLLLAIGVIGITAVLLRRVREHVAGRHVPGGILISNPRAYDSHARLLFGSFYRAVASDVAATAAPGTTVLEVGCGPGHLSIELAQNYGLNLTGLDLDPAMIERARTNAETTSHIVEPGPAFVLGDVAALPFDDASFDLVVSTLSMHHWSDPAAGLAEIARVLRPGGRALIWDLRPGFRLFHAHVPDPSELLQEAPLRIVSLVPWRWPWRFSFSRRMEMARD
jgi:ubiquinone/menaquinone biosynthesis C-methylase UbiE